MSYCNSCQIRVAVRLGLLLGQGCWQVRIVVGSSSLAGQGPRQISVAGRSGLLLGQGCCQVMITLIRHFFVSSGVTSVVNRIVSTTQGVGAAGVNVSASPLSNLTSTAVSGQKILINSSSDGGKGLQVIKTSDGRIINLQSITKQPKIVTNASPVVVQKSQIASSSSIIPQGTYGLLWFPSLTGHTPPAWILSLFL